MKYRVTGNMYFEGTVDIKDEDETVKAFSDNIYNTDGRGLAEHIAICYIAREMDFVEGVGNQGEAFLIEDESTEYQDVESTVLDLINE